MRTIEEKTNLFLLYGRYCMTRCMPRGRANQRRNTNKQRHHTHQNGRWAALEMRQPPSHESAFVVARRVTGRLTVPRWEAMVESNKSVETGLGLRERSDIGHEQTATDAVYKMRADALVPGSYPGSPRSGRQARRSLKG